MGHFFFPDFVLTTQEKIYIDIHSKDRKRSIVPVFDISDQGIVLDEIYTIAANDKFEPRFTHKKICHNIFLCENDKLYELFYKSHSIYRNPIRELGLPVAKAKKLLKFPG